ncbi:MAG: hypothetical protein NVS1B2_13280 [Vulcanimicrobiaceae bacterium]
MSPSGATVRVIDTPADPPAPRAPDAEHAAATARSTKARTSHSLEAAASHARIASSRSDCVRTNANAA